MVGPAGCLLVTMVVNEAYATTAGVGADSAAPVVTEAAIFAAFLAGAFATFAGADFLGVAFWTTTFFATFAGEVFTAAFLTRTFLASIGSGFAAAAFFAAQRFFVAATIRFMPSSLMRRFAFGRSGAAAASLLL